MKLHRSLVKAVIETLHQIMEGGRYADSAVGHSLQQNSKWGSRDRRYIAETVYDMVRWWRLLITILYENEENSTIDYYKLIAVNKLIKGYDVPDWPEFDGINKSKIIDTAERIKKIRKYRESIPDWLDQLGVDELGESIWTSELAELNKEARVVLRVNTLKTSRIQLQHLLLEQGIETSTIGDYADALVLSKRSNLNYLTEYKLGLFEVQDASSQLIAPFLAVEEGMCIIDACAGAGGKSLHIASLIKNKGKIICMDVEDRKLVELKKRAHRGGASCIQTKLISIDTVNQFKNMADCVLLDAPCSGLGVLRRNPDAKWKLNLSFINKIKQTQQEIITNYSQMVKPNGILVYATCSILPSENQQQVEQFISKNKNFKFIEDKKVFPSEGFDGFYMAKLKRTL
ncbi:MAG: class I SAM-dependent methyltransferase [Bacteroidia bacterium]